MVVSLNSRLESKKEKEKSDIQSFNQAVSESGSAATMKCLLLKRRMGSEVQSFRQPNSQSAGGSIIQTVGGSVIQTVKQPDSLVGDDPAALVSDVQEQVHLLPDRQ